MYQGAEDNINGIISSSSDKSKPKSSTVKTRISMIFNLSFWGLIMASFITIILLFTEFYSPRGATWPTTIWILMALPIFSIAAYIAIWIYFSSKGYLGERLKFGAGSITFAFFVGGAATFLLFLAMSIRYFEIGHVLMVFSPLGTLVIYVATNRLILRMK